MIIIPIILLLFTNGFFVSTTWINKNSANDTLIEGDIEGMVHDDRNMLSAGLALHHKLWPNGVIPYVFGRKFRQTERTLIESVMAQFNFTTCIKFVPRKHQRNFIRIELKRKCSSYVGMYEGEQKVYLARQCLTINDILHELMHVIGFYHEQNRPDRDTYVTIRWENVIEEEFKNFKLQSTTNVTTSNTPYDFASIMHYPSNAFSKNGLSTVVPKQAGVKIMADGLSTIDILEINLLYNCSRNGSSEKITVKLSPYEKLKEDIIHGRRPIHGVNLGGWLTVEYFLTKNSPVWTGVPEDIAYQGEYKTMAYLGHERGDPRFKEHRDSFITEEDFIEIKRANLNTVRIPVGYWITGFDNTGGSCAQDWEKFAPGSLQYLDTAIREWAPKHGLLVIINIQAAKGSQNGEQHSSPSKPGSSLWWHRENVVHTLDVVEFLANRYKNDEAFLGIGLLNGPAGETNEFALKQYYIDAYEQVRKNSDCLLTVMPLRDHQSSRNTDWMQFMRPPHYGGILHEWHRYQIWGYEGWDADRLISFVQNVLKPDIQSWRGNRLFVGEWNIVPTNPNITDDEWKGYADAMIDAVNHAQAGWSYNTWKFYNDTGNDKNGWSMKSMLKHGIIKITKQFN